MSAQIWSVVLQWSRVATSALVFLVAARFLTLAELGLFATAFAPVRLTQSLHRVGIGEAVIVYGRTPGRLDALFMIALTSGLALTGALCALGWLVDKPVLSVLAVVPLVNGAAAVSEGLLRHALRIRTLALRTLAAQGVAAGAALYLLAEGGGTSALVAFAIINVSISASLSIWQAGWVPTGNIQLRLVVCLWSRVLQITGRDLLSSGMLPVIQVIVAMGSGLPAAGAFQIAVRVLGLVDALIVAPIRFTALPRLKEAGDSRQVLVSTMGLTTSISAWVWGGIVAAGPQIVSLAAGASHAGSATPILLALAGFGLTSALAMPLNQALIAQGELRLVLWRATILFAGGIAAVAGTIGFGPVPAAVGISLAALAVLTWYLPRAMSRLGLDFSELAPLLAPVLAAGAMAAGLLAAPPMPLSAKVILGTGVYVALLAVHRRMSAVLA